MTEGKELNGTSGADRAPPPRPPSPAALSYPFNLITSFISFPVKFTSELLSKGSKQGA